jgi:hypothetical protein
MEGLRRAGLVMVLGVVALVQAAAAAGAAQDRLPAIIAAYLDVQGQLAADKTDTVPAQAKVIVEEARAMGASGQAMAGTAADLAKAATLEDARKAFGPLSEAVIAAASAAGWKGLDEVKVAYCPMVRRSWLQKDEAIRNPYYGKAMSNCGEFKPKS